MKTINFGGEDVTGAPQQRINLATESDNTNMSWPITSQQHQQQCHLFSDYHKWCDYLTWSAEAVSSTPTVLTWPPPGDVTIDIWPVSNAYQVAWQQYDPSVFLAHQSKACCQYPTPFHALCVIRPSTVSPCDHCQRTYHQTTGVQGFSADMFNVSLSLSDLQVPSDLDLNPDPQCVDYEQVTRGEGETMTSFLSDKNATHLLTDAHVLSSIDRSFMTSDNCSTSSKELKDEADSVTSAASSTGNSDMPAIGTIVEPNTKTARVMSLRKRTASSTSINSSSSSSSDEEQLCTIVSCASMTPPSSSSSSSSASARKKRARISSSISNSSSSSDAQWLEEVTSTRGLSRPAEPPRKARISGSSEQLVLSSATRQPSIRLSASKKKACCSSGSSNSSNNKDNSSNNSGNNYCDNSSKNTRKSNSENNSDNSSSISGNETTNDYNDNSSTNSRNNENNNSCISNGNNKNSDSNYNSGKNNNSNNSGNNKNNSSSKQQQETSAGADTFRRQSSRLRSRQHAVLTAVSGMEPNKPRASSGKSNNHGQAQRRNQQKLK